MKKIIFAFIFTFAIQFAYADQLAWISKEQAEKAVAFLKKYKQVMLYCACCNIEDPKTIVDIKDVYFRHPKMGNEEQTDVWEVVIKGKTADGKEIETEVDLAYIHVKKGNKAVCLGKELAFECDPCVVPFDFKWKQ